MGGVGEPMLDMLDGMGAEVCIPLINKDQVVGFCNLGCRPARQMYSPADLDLLTTLGQNAAIAVDNARLYEDLRQLYEDLQQSQRLVLRTDRLRSLEIMAAGFAHEVRNPLTSIKTFVQLAPTRTADLDFVTNFSAIVADDVLRIERLIQEILDYARYQHRQLSEEDVNELLNASIYFLQVKGEQQGITVVKCLDAELPRVTLDRQQIKQVFLNLFLNAFEAMTDKGGTLTLTSRPLTKRTSEPYVEIEIRDTGCGIPAKDLDHIFDPFFTTKHESSEGREGTGLGLAIVHQIVVEHGGSIEVTSTVGVGTVFIIQLPCLPPPHLGPPPEP
jgi:signal transduction histidine kinase